MKKCAQSLTKPLAMLFRKSFNEGSLPVTLKYSRIVPIFKSGLKSSARNYRSVAIIPTIMKIFEMDIYNKIHDFVHRRISQCQHDFVKGRSTATNLLEMVNYTMDGMIAKCQTDVLYTDYEKAFDRVKHKGVLKKLANIDFGKRLLKWFYAYLTARKQFVQIGLMKSNSFAVPSGVPAGSILGPILFSIFINDIVDYVTNANVLLFADDLKLMRTICTPIDALLFQGAINQLQEWCEINSLYLNIKKCYVMTYSRIRNTTQYEYTFNNGQHVFQRVEMHRDLGLIFDSKLTFEPHRNAVIASAQATLWFIKRTLKNKFSINAAKILYCSLIRSKLEYCCIVWNVYQNCHIDRIESIQKLFLIWALNPIYQREKTMFCHLMN